METLLGYRHVVTKKTLSIFVSSLKKAIKVVNPNKLGLIGIISPREKKQSFHDIDLVIFPHKKSKVGESFLELLKLYEVIEDLMKEKHPRNYLVPCPTKVMQELVYYLASLEEGSAGLIPLHSLFFVDRFSFEKRNPVEFVKSSFERLEIFHGSFENIPRKSVLTQKKLEPYFWIIEFEMTARLKSFPRHLIRTSAESLFKYLEREYGLKTKKKEFHEISEIEEEVISLLKKLDGINYMN